MKAHTNGFTRHRARLLVGIAIAGVAPFAIATSITPVLAATIVVNDTSDSPRDNSAPGGVCQSKIGVGSCTLRAAVETANKMGSPVVIQLAAATYHLTIPSDIKNITGRKGALQLDGDITISGQGSGNTTIMADKAANDRVMRIGRGSTNGCTTQGGAPTSNAKPCPKTSPSNSVDLVGLTITGGVTQAPSSATGDSLDWAAGGGIEDVSIGTVTLDDVVVTANKAVECGSTEGCFFLGSRGGGVSVNLPLNSSFGATAGHLVVVDSAITNNSADFGGGGLQNLGTATVTNSTISGNSVTDTASQNVGIESYNGGAILNGGSEVLPVLNLTNVTISGNTSLQGGGGLASQFSVVSLQNVTFDGNSAIDGANIYAADTTTKGAKRPIGSIRVNNTIVGSAIGGSSCFTEGQNEIKSFGWNLDKAHSCGFTNSGDQQDVASPGLDTGLKANGGLTETIALLKGSPAIDKAELGTCPSTDQRHVSRPQGAGCDIGAYEYVPVTTSTGGQQGVPTVPKAGVGYAGTVQRGLQFPVVVMAALVLLFAATWLPVRRQG